MKKDNALLILIESLDGRQIVTENAFCGWLGATKEEWLYEQDFEVKLTTINGLSVYINVNKHRNILPIGSIEFMNRAASIMEIELPKPINIPNSLKDIIERKTWVCKRKDISFPCFIKPNTDTKLFTGFVATSDSKLDMYPELLGFDGDFLCSEIMSGDIQSEWRCFIVNKKVINCSCYSGNSLVFPDTRIINNLIEAYIDAPSGYALDVAVTMNDFAWKYYKTQLVEINDGWALGNYGCDPQDYFKLLRTRWFEIIKQDAHELQ